LLLLGSLASLP